MMHKSYCPASIAFEILLQNLQVCSDFPVPILQMIMRKKFLILYAGKYGI
jgi:hypothetical protein